MILKRYSPKQKGVEMDLNESVKQFIIQASKEKESRIHAYDIAKHFKIKEIKVYQIVRQLKEQGFGIELTQRGYVYTKYASQKDDVNFLSRMLGHRMYVDCCLRPTIKHIKGRWPHNQLALPLFLLYRSIDQEDINEVGATLLDLGKRLDEIANKHGRL